MVEDCFETIDYESKYIIYCLIVYRKIQLDEMEVWTKNEGAKGEFLSKSVCPGDTNGVAESD